MKMLENHAVELEHLESLLSVASVVELKSQLENITRKLGFNHFSCGVMDLAPETRVPSFRLLSCYPEDWQAHYNANSYFEEDPVITHTIRHRKPLPAIWPVPGVLNEPLHHRLFSEAADFGMSSGVTVSSQGANQVSVLSLSSEWTLSQIKGELPKALGFAQLLACYLQEVWNRLAEPATFYKACKLSGRELECLHWASVGKTSWEIARILNISERTVVFHIGRAVKKMDVSNRRQAVAKAITMGYIHP